MADAPQTPPGGDAATPGTGPRVLVQTQYIKDLSFENPRAPGSFEPSQTRPEIQVRVDVRAQGVGDDRYEVALQLHVDAKAGEQTVFMTELTYAGLFVMQNVPKENLQAILLVEGPRLLFPFARRIVADATRDGGFPPLMIDPIDFLALYRRRQQAQAESRPADSTATGDPRPN